MRFLKPRLLTVALFHILSVACFFLIISNEFIPIISNILAGGVFIFALLGLLSLILYVLNTKSHVLAKVISVPILVVFGGSILFYVFIFTGFSVRDSVKFDYMGQTYYYRHDSTTYTNYSLYRKNGPITMIRLLGMTREEQRLPYEKERVEDIIDRIENNQ